MANESKPPITWEALPYVFFGSMLAMFILVTIQVFRESKKYGQWALNGMAACIVYFIATGGTAAILAGHPNPEGMLFLTVGLGGAVGISGSWYIFQVRHLNKRL